MISRDQIFFILNDLLRVRVRVRFRVRIRVRLRVRVRVRIWVHDQIFLKKIFFIFLQSPRKT